MTDRKKIIETLRASGYGFFITHEITNADEALADAADALIADGIGDVSEWKRRAEVAERQAVVLSKWLAEKTKKDYPWRAWLDAAQKQAEKELAEEERK